VPLAAPELASPARAALRGARDADVRVVEVRVARRPKLRRRDPQDQPQRRAPALGFGRIVVSDKEAPNMLDYGMKRMSR
jgi:hypothetical protein